MTLSWGFVRLYNSVFGLTVINWEIEILNHEISTFKFINMNVKMYDVIYNIQVY